MDDVHIIYFESSLQEKEKNSSGLKEVIICHHIQVLNTHMYLYLQLIGHLATDGLKLRISFLDKLHRRVDKNLSSQSVRSVEA